MIYLVRHGLDDESYIGGHSDVDLIPEGIEQITNAAHFIKENLVFDKMYSSDIKRAISSAEIISKIIGKSFEILPYLRELDKGLLTGMLKEEALKKYPEYMGNISVNDVYPAGESMQMFYERMDNSFENLIQMDNSLIVLHRGNINMWYFKLLNMKVDMDKKQFGATHGSIHELDIKNGTIKKIYRR